MANSKERKPVRRLSTIVFVDIVGYTKMMQANELSALETLNLFKEIVETSVSHYQGRLIQYFGDGSLLSFVSTTDGVRAAMSIQQEAQKLMIPLRIGIHLGEVTYQGNNIFGDGVNIASRIETISSPGSILLSKATRDQIRNKDEFEIKELGDFKFKNVEEAIRVFAIANKGFKVPKANSVKGKLERETKKNQILAMIAPFLLVQ